MGYAGSPPAPEGSRASNRFAPAASDADRRLQGLENQLRMLMDQVKELRELQERQPKTDPRQSEDGHRPAL